MSLDVNLVALFLALDGQTFSENVTDVFCKNISAYQTVAVLAELSCSRETADAETSRLHMGSSTGW